MKKLRSWEVGSSFKNDRKGHSGIWSHQNSDFLISLLEISSLHLSHCEKYSESQYSEWLKQLGVSIGPQPIFVILNGETASFSVIKDLIQSQSITVSFQGKVSFIILQFSSVQSLSRVRLFATPWIAAHKASLSITNSRSSLRLTSIESVMPTSHLTLLSPSPPAANPSQHQSLFQWVNSSHEVAKVLEFQL